MPSHRAKVLVASMLASAAACGTQPGGATAPSSTSSGSVTAARASSQSAAVASATPKASDSAYPSVGPERVLYEHGLIRISSDVALSEESMKRFAERAEHAYRTAADLHGWQVEGDLAKPFTVHLFSQEVAERDHPGLNLACAGDHVLAHARVIDDPGFTDGTLVHEETHLLHNRKGVGHLGHYLEEGTAQELQRRYDAEYQKDKARFVSNMQGETPFLAAMAPEEAKRLLEQTVWDKKDIGPTEDLGCLFVEFLRTKLGGTGYPDYAKRIAHMVETMPKLALDQPGWREEYLKHLHGEFGDRTEVRFLDYLRDTAGKPGARFAGTVFEPWLEDATVQKRLKSNGL
jgi:hypothetical protein